jgi:hypothetical protein
VKAQGLRRQLDNGGKVMPPLTNPEIIDKFRDAFVYASSGGVAWKTVPAAEWVRKNLPGVTQRAIENLLLAHVNAGKKINEVIEKREEWLHDCYHYDFIISVNGKQIYVETTIADTKSGAIVTVVNVHPNRS